MALQILENNGTFQLEGSLNTNTTQSFILHFEYMVQTVKKVTLDIGQLTFIDATGVKALKNFIAIGSKNQGDFSIIGNGCKDIYEDYQESVAA